MPRLDMPDLSEWDVLYEFSGWYAGKSSPVLQGWDLFDTVTDWCPVPRERLRNLTARTRRGP